MSALTRLQRSLGVVALVVTSTAAGAGAVSAADPEQPAAPPVVTGESVEIGGVPRHGYTRSYTNLLANDHDPNGGSLTLCGIDNPHEDAISVSLGGRPPAEPGLVSIGAHLNETATYEITYSVCNEQAGAEGILTVDVFRVDPVEVQVVSPGRLEFTNPGTRAVIVTYGRRTDRSLDGRFRLAPAATRVVTVHRSTIHWYAHHLDYPAGAGRIDNTGAADHAEVPKLVAEAIGPYRVRFTNPGGLRALIVYGKALRQLKGPKVDGSVELAAGASTVIRTRRDVLAYRSKAPYGLSLGHGRVRHLGDPRPVQRPTRG
ncbi:hypothetical protein [Nocardioides sp.]|uniref:hypothetical protein n=1 Tax=Nocardioides sp. TaxID=35761 RepID=UPI002B26F1C5|nr:hypothetical protein [Nocardioides sp.]